MFHMTRSAGFGIPVNEMQRTINGFGHAGFNRIIPYDSWMPYSPRQARGQGYVGKWPPMAKRRKLSLGDVPNDFEASVDLQYIPVRQAWYYGYPINGGSYPDARGGFGEVLPSDPVELKRVAKYEMIQTGLQVISTLSIATMATLTVARAIVESRRGRARSLGRARRRR